MITKPDEFEGLITTPFQWVTSDRTRGFLEHGLLSRFTGGPMRPTDEAARSATLVLESLDAELVDSAKPVDSQFAHNPSTKETEYETSTALVGNLNLPKVHIQATPFLDALDNLKSASDRVCDLAGWGTE